MVEPAAMNAFDACVFSQAYGRQKHLRMLILNRSRKFVGVFPRRFTDATTIFSLRSSMWSARPLEKSRNETYRQYFRFQFHTRNDEPNGYGGVA